MKHARIATIFTDSQEKAIAALQTDADLFEIRLDAFWQDAPDDSAAELLIALLAEEKPLLATLRPTRQGGKWIGDERVRLNLLAACAQAGFACIDIEGDVTEEWLHAVRGDAQIISSFHDFTGAPARDSGLMTLKKLDDRGIAKYAFPASSFLEQMRAMEMVWGHQVRKGHPAIAAMDCPAMIRAALPLAGNMTTYGAANGIAPVSGQPTMAVLNQIWTNWGLSTDELGGKAGWLAVVGSDVSHSKSPALHNKWLRENKRHERYGAINVPESRGALRLLATAAGRIGLKGISITNPHKENALTCCKPDAIATRIGAVNCMRLGELNEGTNTDATAMMRLLANQGKTAMVLGAGGAARAAIVACQELGIAVKFTSRDPERAAKVSNDLGAPWISWGEATEDVDILIQATPATDISYAGKYGTLLEMVYAEETNLLRNHQGNNITGEDLLREQGRDAYKFWFGVEP
jgi:shikimate dehydrogenase